MGQEQVPRESRILQHLDRWKHLYQTCGLVGVAVAITIGSLSLIQTAEALRIARNSLKLSHDTLELQEEEFMLRNRPLVVIGSHEFSGPTENLGTENVNDDWPRSVTLKLLNISEIPATEVQGTIEIRLDGEVVAQVPVATDLDLAGDFPRGIVLGISEETHSAATNPSRRFEIATFVTYSGMLGEQPDQYSTRVVVHWSPSDGRFMSSEASYK
jgi:hypothetical protein